MIDTGAIEKVVSGAPANDIKSVEEYKSNKEGAFNALIDQMMKVSKSRTNLQQI